MQYRLSTIFLVFFVVAASLAAFGDWGLFVAAGAFALALLVYFKKASLPEVVFSLVIIGTFVALSLPAIQHSGGAPLRAHCTNNMKQIGLGLHNYWDVHKHFPSLITYDKNGKPLFSWLVEILPYMEYDTIYTQLHKDEPWDSPHNAIVLGKLQINELLCPRASEKPNHFPSHYLAVAGPGTAWRSEGVVKLEDIPNTSLTVMAVECVVSDKHWAEPYFLTVDEVLERMKTGKGTRISTVHNGGVNVLFADGSVRGLRADMPISLWRKLLMGEIKSMDELENVESTPDDPAPKNLWLNQPSPSPSTLAVCLSVMVWLFSLALLFYRAWKSRPLLEKPALTAE
jgi:prepilin-type processing-associated H-X9-DG protein